MTTHDPRRARSPRNAEPRTFRVRVELERSSPPIWRLLDVRSDLGLDAVHHVLQAAFGWSDSHLYRFALGNPFDPEAELFLCCVDVEEGEDEGTPTTDVSLEETLSEVGDVLSYCYDYGDSWDLTLTLESTRPLNDTAPMATCVAGARAAPPEDCGGLRTETALAEVLLDPAHFDLQEINQALTDPYLQLRESGIHPNLLDILNRLRDTRTGDQLVGRTMSLKPLDPSSTEQRAAALHPFLWFLDHVGSDGLALTSAGYLRPQDVRAAATVIPDMAHWIGTADREHHTVPILRFREGLQKLGLLRKYRGRLLLTKAGSTVRGQPDELWRHLAHRLPFGQDNTFEAHAGLLALLLAATTPDKPVPYRLIADALSHLGWRHAGDHQLVTDHRPQGDRRDHRCPREPHHRTQKTQRTPAHDHRSRTCPRRHLGSTSDSMTKAAELRTRRRSRQGCHSRCQLPLDHGPSGYLGRTTRPALGRRTGRLSSPRAVRRRLRLMTEYQVTLWRELPSMVVARAGDQTVKAQLPPRFQEAIDEAAMRLGETGADDYLAGWGRSLWTVGTGTPAEVLDRVIAELDAEWPVSKVARYLDGLGR